MKLSIIIPLYNECGCIATLLDQVLQAPLCIEKQIIVVNDGSTDGSEKVVEKWINSHPTIDIQLLNKSNGGKGSAFRMGVEHSTGDIVINQDADLEYDPKDIQACINPILNNECFVVYGSREMGETKAQSNLFFHLGGHAVTCFTNLLYGSALTDEATCYKVYEGNLIRTLLFEGNQFDWEPEITAKLLRLGFEIKEVPVSYSPRPITAGKKIKWKDGLDAFWTLLKFRFSSLHFEKEKLSKASKLNLKETKLPSYALVLKTNKRILLTIALLTFCAFCLRLLLAWPSLKTGVEAFLRPDSAQYTQGALSLSKYLTYADSAGNILSFYPPLYSFFLGCFYSLFGEHSLSPVIAGILLSTALAPLTYLIAKRMTTRPVALIAMGFITFNITMISAAPMILTDTFFSFIVAFIILFMARFYQSGQLISLLFAIVFAGISCYIRPVMLFWWFPALFLLWIRSGNTCSQKIKFSIISLILFFIILFPWMLRNDLNEAGFSMTSSAGSVYRYHATVAMLAIQKNENSHEIRNRFYTEDEAVFRANPDSFRTIAQRNEYQAKRAIETIKSNPLLFLRLHIRPSIMLPDVATLCENLTITTTGRGTFDVLNREGFVAAIKSYFNGHMPLFYLLTPFILLTFIFYLATIYRLVLTLIRREFFLFFFFMGCSYYFLFVCGPVTMPRYQMPALFLIAILGAMGLKEVFIHKKVNQ